MMDKKYCVKALPVVMSLLLGILSVFHSNLACARGAKKCSIFKGNCKVLSVRAKKGVKWKVSGSSCLKMVESKSENKVMLVARKSGKAKVTAKYGSKKATWNITAKKDKASHLALKKVTVGPGKVVVETTAHLYSSKKKNVFFKWGQRYQLYQYSGTKWKKILFKDHYAFDANAKGIILKKKAKVKIPINYTLDVKNFKNWNMESGLYKLVANTDLPTDKEYVLFEI